MGKKLICYWLSGDEVISTQSIPPWLFSEVLSPQIAPLSHPLLPKLSTLVDCCLEWVVQHMQLFFMLLAAHRHHIIVSPLLLSNCHCPITVFKLLLLLSSTLSLSVAAATSLPLPLPLSSPLSSPSLPCRHCRHCQRWFVIIIVVLLLGSRLEEMDKTKSQRHCPWHAEGLTALGLAMGGERQC